VVQTVVLLAIMAMAVWWFALAPVAVITHKIELGDITSEVLGTGTLEARIHAIVGPKISGLIESIAVDQGDHVKIGDTLIVLEDIDAKQLVAVAQADVAAAEAGLDRLRADLRRAQAVETQAKLTHSRLVQAIAAAAGSQQELDKAAEALAVAQADVASATAGIAEGQRKLAASERSLDYQRARLHDTTIEAPFDALVIKRDREAGDVVAAGSSVLQLISLDEMWITAWVDETQLSRLAPEQPARVVFRSEPNTEYRGVVARLGREADRETREIVVDVSVDRLPETWAVGQRAEVYINVATAQSVPVLPSDLVILRDGTAGVMVDIDGRVQWREIKIGLRGRTSVEIASGLSAGDLVVTPAAAKSKGLRIGRRTKPQ